MIACLLAGIAVGLVGWTLLGFVIAVVLGRSIRLGDAGGPLGTEQSDDTPETPPPEVLPP